MVKNVLTAGSVVPLLVALVLFKFVVSTVVRSILVVIALAVGILLFTQRSAIDDCVESFSREGTSVSATCSILGYDIDLDL